MEMSRSPTSFEGLFLKGVVPHYHKLSQLKTTVLFPRIRHFTSNEMIPDSFYFLMNNMIPDSPLHSLYFIILYVEWMNEIFKNYI